ncbi:NADPH-dependent FMN reductase [Salibacterium halotolerans]|uniref:FMN reductase n=1 Tax=Salibacterium halotolerans TaxID=1884432 RepID=A0A1I5R3L5_9BACI|nr:NADPH-dependent FMN reductase [Salibacterium halotolerans]SFP52911.1 FMN reductase [Salibacterium halotolerans]
MNVVALSGSTAGSKTRTAMDYTAASLQKQLPDSDVTLLDLAEYDVQFSDGRHHLDYDGDTGYVVRTMMEADAVIIGTPVFQASIPGTLKNLFDLLPGDGFSGKVVSMLVTAGSAKHYLIAEQQLKPILGYMKAEIVQGYVFIEEKNFYQKQITDDDVLFRIDRLVEDTAFRTGVLTRIQEEQDAAYDF